MKARRKIHCTLITVGDEILQGDIANGNAHHIAQALRSNGFHLQRMVTVGDEEEAVVGELKEAVARSDALVVTGGLGPTPDDLTDQAAARAFQRPLTPDPFYNAWLREYVTSRGRPWTENLERMTRIPEGAVKLGKPMAGFFLEQEGVPCFFLPGVPFEMRILMEEAVLPELDRRFPGRPACVKRILRVQELVESRIGRFLEGWEEQETGVRIGYLPQTAENWITLLAEADTEEEASRRVEGAVAEVLERVGARYVSGYDGDTLEKVVGDRLRERGWKLAVAESCTGGLLARKIASVAGASDYFDRGLVTYSNEAKTELLGVEEGLIRKHGAVSDEVARAMAEGALHRSGANATLAITGIAGPSGGTEEKPVGTVFIACATAEETVAGKYLFSGPRPQVQERSAQAALTLLWRVLCP